MTEKIDRRRARTKALLYKALVEVMTEKGIDRVTVSDLTAKADINRGTFYLHYKDVADLIDQVKDDIWVGLQGKMAQLHPYDYQMYAARNQAYPPMVQIIEYYAHHASFFRAILGPHGDPTFALRVQEFLKQQHMARVIERKPAIAAMILPYDYIIPYMVAANLRIIQQWLETGMQHSSRTIALMITHSISGASRTFPSL